MALIFGSSSMSADEIVPVGPDKLIHGIVFCLLALLMAPALSGGWLLVKPRFSGWAWLAASLYGVSDEFHQRFVPGRSSCFDDVLADSSGALIGAAIALLVPRVAQRCSARRAASGRSR